MNGYFGSRPNTSYSTITDIFSGVTSNFEALVGEYTHRLSHSVSFSANYTWSHALDFGENNTTGAGANAVFDVNNLALEKGNSNQNVPNRLVVYTVGQSPWHFHGPLAYLLNNYEIAPSFQTQNGLPYSAGISTSASKLFADGATKQSALVATSLNGSGGTNRLPNLDRNSLSYPKTWNLDLRLSKAVAVRERYRLEFLAEAFNLANHQNVTGVGTTAYLVSEDTTNHANDLAPYTSTPFTSITSTNNSNFAYNVRQIQMALRLKF